MVSDLFVTAKMIAALDWWWMAVVATALTVAAIGVWAWLTDRIPGKRSSAPRSGQPADAARVEVPQDDVRPAA